MRYRVRIESVRETTAEERSAYAAAAKAAAEENRWRGGGYLATESFHAPTEETSEVLSYEADEEQFKAIRAAALGVMR